MVEGCFLSKNRRNSTFSNLCIYFGKVSKVSQNKSNFLPFQVFILLQPKTFVKLLSAKQKQNKSRPLSTCLWQFSVPVTSQTCREKESNFLKSQIKFRTFSLKCGLRTLWADRWSFFGLSGNSFTWIWTFSSFSLEWEFASHWRWSHK